LNKFISFFLIALAATTIVSVATIQKTLAGPSSGPGVSTSGPARYPATYLNLYHPSGENSGGKKEPSTSSLQKLNQQLATLRLQAKGLSRQLNAIQSKMTADKARIARDNAAIKNPHSGVASNTIRSDKARCNADLYAQQQSERATRAKMATTQATMANCEKRIKATQNALTNRKKR